jgi:hypothetical protein
MGGMSDLALQLELNEISRKAYYKIYGEYPDDLPSRRSDPETSRNRLSADRITRIQQDILNYVSRYPGGVTDLDIQTFFNDQGSTYRTRRAELTERGLLKDSGERMRQQGRRRVLWQRT